MVLFVALFGCGAKLGKKGLLKNEAQTWRFRHQPEIVQEAAARVLEAKGFDIKISDPEKGYIETEHIKLKRTRDKVTMRFEKEGSSFTRVTCLIKREKKGLLGDEWSPEEEIDPDMYRNLKDDLEYYIYRSIYDRY